ncbi:Tat (twin-arginine translocation) pathway signal sequence [Loktanella sp. DSM 29012]|uniref:Twin-arginine translocation signal domain-containing protein n=1 Tax=Loktanella gaetbuli TaxID=2881335 RepID=A0ABS8BQ09_9RHOB|nr:MULTISPECIES: twin-arginine translocation signal domain-containing protein [Loktanella]MCB5197722.1 twin-arginine translocation signal domain-containing protein [Loktanella gaetbuli]SEP92771.1 Tat (twin-arginine translocation) pathway signal sequence [Loktanella sp. DSM 29012]
MTEDTKGTNRRGFLKLAGTAAPAAIAAVAIAKPDAAQAKPVDLSSTTIQDTEHTRTYLASARF